MLAKAREPVDNEKAYLLGVCQKKLMQYYDKRRRRSAIAEIVWSSQLMTMASLSTSLSLRVARHNDLEAAMQKLTVCKSS